MSDTRAIEDVEAELARDTARIQEIERIEKQMLDQRSREGFRVAAEGVRLQAEMEMLEDRIIRNRQLLVVAEHRRL